MLYTDKFTIMHILQSMRLLSIAHEYTSFILFKFSDLLLVSKLNQSHYIGINYDNECLHLIHY